MTDFYQVDLSDGIAQPERFPEALRPGYFAPDEMRVEQLLVLGKRLAANLIYFDSNNNRVGTWDELFATDPAFILAEIASTDTAKLEARYYKQIAKRSSSARADLIEEVVSLIDSWSRALQVSDQPQMILFTNKINQVIRDTLAEAVAEVRAVLGPGGGQVSARFASLGPVWKLPDEGLDDESPADSKRNRILDEAFHLSLGAIAHLKEFARTGLNLSEANRTQNPAVSLFVAFLKLYSHAQHTINRFPARRLDFYYRQLLGATTRGRMPDSVNLALTLAPALLQ